MIALWSALLSFERVSASCNSPNDVSQSLRVSQVLRSLYLLPKESCHTGIVTWSIIGRDCKDKQTSQNTFSAISLKLLIPINELVLVKVPVDCWDGVLSCLIGASGLHVCLGIKILWCVRIQVHRFRHFPSLLTPSRHFRNAPAYTYHVSMNRKFRYMSYNISTAYAKSKDCVYHGPKKKKKSQKSKAKIKSERRKIHHHIVYSQFWSCQRIDHFLLAEFIARYHFNVVSLFPPLK